MQACSLKSATPVATVDCPRKGRPRDHPKRSSDPWAMSGWPKQGAYRADAGVRSGRLDWLFDIVDPREGDWNVYAHDAVRLRELATLCTQKSPPCPLNELRIAGSRFHLLARTYDERDEDAP